MKDSGRFSILFPYNNEASFKQMSECTCHDLGLDTFCKELTNDSLEQRMIMNVLSNMTADHRTAVYRQKIFADILKLPEMRKRLSELFEKIEFIRKFSTNRMESDENLGFWYLMHRVDELDDYIKCVEAMKECLAEEKIESEGLIGFRDYIDQLYNEACFAEMKKDIVELKEKTGNIRSVTLGINVNSRFEAESLGLISVNTKPFKKSGVVSNFADAITSKDKLNEGNEWNGDMHYYQVDRQHSRQVSSFIEKAGSYMAVAGTPIVDGRIRATVTKTPDSDNSENSTFYLDKVLNKMLSSIVKKLRDTLSKYADIAIVNISELIPEFIYYIRFAEFIEKSMEKGFAFCEAHTIDGNDTSMEAEGLYNLKLAVNVGKMDDIVCNDLVFDKQHTIYILTGANRGGKTTITQAVGLLYVLAQGGIYVPASSFGYKPVDCIYTHFPADEDKTLDLGRLGEECVRFRQIYSDCTSDSLLLLNETFSTTSFEEGYYIARDSVRAIADKSVRTIYNTHMHKLAFDADSEGEGVSSLIVKSENGKRSFKVEVASPEGMSYAKDIAEKYGVTYEMLTSECGNN